jgi:hypothetical protein
VSEPSDQQPIARVVGRRKRPPVGEPPSAAARAAHDSFAQRRTRAPKGIFRYTSHEAMQHDRDNWTVQAIVDTVRSRG